MAASRLQHLSVTNDVLALVYRSAKPLMSAGVTEVIANPFRHLIAELPLELVDNAVENIVGPFASAHQVLANHQKQIVEQYGIGGSCGKGNVQQTVEPIFQRVWRALIIKGDNNKQSSFCSTETPSLHIRRPSLNPFFCISENEVVSFDFRRQILFGRMSMIDCLTMSLRSVPTTEIGNGWRTLNLSRMNSGCVTEMTTSILHTIGAPVTSRIVKQVLDAAIPYATIWPTAGAYDSTTIPRASCIVTSWHAAHDFSWSLQSAEFVNERYCRTHSWWRSRCRVWLTCNS
jgi:hypothetical protein